MNLGERGIDGRRTAIAAFAAAAWLACAPAAAGHPRAAHDERRSPAAAAGAVDRAEVAALGARHAREHARGRRGERAARARWARLTPQQRQRRLRADARQTAAINVALAVRTRDDTGDWEPTLHKLPDYAIHASVLPTGDVLYFGYGRDPGVFDPETGATRSVPLPGLPAGTLLYCSAQALLSDGRVLIAGGTLSAAGGAGPRPSGLKYTFLFDPWGQTWETGPRMQHGRWYPTLMKLSNGDVVILSGYDEDGQGTVNPQLDIYRPGDSAASPLVPFRAGERRPGLGADHPLSLYPGLFLLPNENAALAGPGQHDSALLDTTVARDRSAAPGSAWTQIQANQASTSHYGGAPVLEPGLNAFGGSWNVLLVGGARSGDTTGVTPAQATGDRLNAGPGDPAWQPHDPQDDLREPRYYTNNVLLPDGGMVAVGGGAGADYRPPTPAGNWWLGDTPRQALKQVELRRPGERTWRLGAAQQEWRTYHSTAVLLPDGRVMSGGDEKHEGPGTVPLDPSVRRDSAEIYWPPYLFDGDVCAPRPVIRGVGRPGPAGARQWATLSYGESFGIFSEHVGAAPARAVLVAPAAVTHAVDMNQRVVPLAVSDQEPGGGLNVTMPATASIAPPGYYMLFVIAADGTPSQSRWVHVLPPAAADAERGGRDPVPVTGPWPDPQPRTCTPPPPGAPLPPTPKPDPLTPTPNRPQSVEPARPAQAKRPAKLALTRAAIDRRNRRLGVLAPISALATGRVDVDLFAAGRHTRLQAPIDAVRRRVRVQNRIPAAQASRGTGILTLTYRGNRATFGQTVRLRAAPRPAALVVRRPTLSAGGRLRAAGTISSRARGVVRVQLQFGVGDDARILRFSAKIERGAWKLDTQLTTAARDAIAARAGTAHSTVLFTGYGPARMRGEMRSYELLPAP